MLQVGDVRVETAFAFPAGTASEVLALVDRAALGLARARVAVCLGDPDPFHVRAALAAAVPDARVSGCDGVRLDVDAANAALVRAGPATPELAGIFAWSPPGPKVRAVPVDDPACAWLRWQAADAPRPSIGQVRTWSTAEIGDAAVATVRCAVALSGDGVALGSDYGLTLWRNGQFTPFPWPKGARREARRVEAMAVHGGQLHVGTSQAHFAWDFRDRVTLQRHGADEDDGFDDLLSMVSSGERLQIGFRTRFEGGVGPRDALSLTAGPNGVVYAGTRDGELHVVDGGGPARVFAGTRGRPVRHLAFATGALWVAAAGALHRFDGTSWSARAPEPTALAADAAGRLWALAEGRLHVLAGDALHEVAVDVERPWSLACTPGAVWVGGRERVWRVAVG